MHELKRRAYLDAMGIATYISRRPLKGAAAGSKLMVVKRPIAPGATSVIAVDSVPSAIPISIPRVESTKIARTARPAEAKPAQDGSVAPVTQFSIVALKTGDWLWLEQLPEHQALMQNQLLLVQSMAQALGLGKQKPAVAHFNWPIHTNSQLDLGVEAARASLGGFVSRKLDNERCTALVMLGSDCQSWLAAEQLGVDRVIATLSTAQMLEEPQLKKQVWRDLLAHSI